MFITDLGYPCATCWRWVANRPPSRRVKPRCPRLAPRPAAWRASRIAGAPVSPRIRQCLCGLLSASPQRRPGRAAHRYLLSRWLGLCKWPLLPSRQRGQWWRSGFPRFSWVHSAPRGQSCCPHLQCRPVGATETGQAPLFLAKDSPLF